MSRVFLVLLSLDITNVAYAILDVNERSTALAEVRADDSAPMLPQAKEWTALLKSVGKPWFGDNVPEHLKDDPPLHTIHQCTPPCGNRCDNQRSQLKKEIQVGSGANSLTCYFTIPDALPTWGTMCGKPLMIDLWIKTLKVPMQNVYAPRWNGTHDSFSMAPPPSWHGMMGPFSKPEYASLKVEVPEKAHGGDRFAVCVGRYSGCYEGHGGKYSCNSTLRSNSEGNGLTCGNRRSGWSMCF